MTNAKNDKDLTKLGGNRGGNEESLNVKKLFQQKSTNCPEKKIAQKTIIFDESEKKHTHKKNAFASSLQSKLHRKVHPSSPIYHPLHIHIRHFLCQWSKKKAPNSVTFVVPMKIY